MADDAGTPAGLRASVRLTKQEIAHLWSGGILSLKIESPEVEADLELRCPEAASERGTRILIKRVTVE